MIVGVILLATLLFCHRRGEIVRWSRARAVLPPPVPLCHLLLRKIGCSSSVFLPPDPSSASCHQYRVVGAIAVAHQWWRWSSSSAAHCYLIRRR